MQVAKWGNSLAIRIPARVAREMDLKEGDVVNVIKATADTLALEDREAIIARIRQLAKPLPPGWKFDREEANARGPYPTDSAE